MCVGRRGRGSRCCTSVGSGTKLTAAGYLPPVVVEQIAQEAGVSDWWIGKANREDLTPPVAALRYTAQDVGLLRKAKGQLTPTARARAAAEDPRDLVATVLGRLPVGTGFQAEAGWFALLGRAAGGSRRGSGHGRCPDPDRPRVAHRWQLTGQRDAGTPWCTGDVRAAGVDGRWIQGPRPRAAPRSWPGCPVRTCHAGMMAERFTRRGGAPARHNLRRGGPQPA